MMLATWMAGWRAPRRIESPRALAAFLSAEAALVAQKCLIGYCHVKTHLPLSELLRDAQFVDAYDKGRWEAYGAVLSDLAIIVEGRLRPFAGEARQALASRLGDLAADILAGQPPPRGEEDGWDIRADEIRRRLFRAQLSEPEAIVDVAQQSAQQLFESLPIHERLREPDREAVLASVRFMLVSRCGRLDRRLDASVLVPALLDGP